jgi:hypothetical protein
LQFPSAENRELNIQISQVAGKLAGNIFGVRAKIPDLCPNSAILLLKQGISREFPVFDVSHSQATAYATNKHFSH